jgi:hypothetical protein
MMKKQTLTVLLFSMVAVWVLAACEQQTPPTVIVPVQTQNGDQAIPVLPTVTSLAPTLAPTSLPTPVPLFVSAYRHRSGVFAINQPEQWEVLDNSTPQRLFVRMLPPMGYGSRITIELVNEGPLTPDGVRQLAESYIRLNYADTSGYSEINRSDLSDGRLQYVFLYDDRRGATGRETLTIQQAGPFFTAMRVFLSDRDAASLGVALEQVAGSLQVDAAAPWGTEVAAINPAELQITHTLLWRDRLGVTYYGGDLLNASPADISNASVTVSFCDKAGISVAQITQPIDLHVVLKGTSAPFGITVEELPADVRVCSETANADPAMPDPNFTTAASLAANVSYNQWRRDLTIDGPITNFGLVPVSRIQVVIVVYDGESRVIAYVRQEFESTLRLDPGQSTPFSIVIPFLGGQPHHVATLVQSRIIGATDASLAPTNTSIAPTPTP